MRRHPHRHRSLRRRPRFLQRVASATFLGVGICVLVGLCLLTPTGRFILALAAVVPALAALVRLGYLTGRSAARTRNSFALHHGRLGLEKIMRAQHDAQHARLA